MNQLKKIFLLTSATTFLSSCMIDAPYQHYINQSRAFSKPHLVCEIKREMTLFIRQPHRFILSEFQTTPYECGSVTLQQYQNNPSRWKEWRGSDPTYRIVGVITPGTKYRVIDIFNGHAWESGYYPFTLDIESGPFAGIKDATITSSHGPETF